MTQNAISLAGVMVVFAGLCALAIVFIWKFLPETKGLPVEEIVQVFERQQKESALSTAAPSGQLRREKAELAMRCDVLKRSVASGSGCEGRQVASVGLIAPQGQIARHPAGSVLPGAGCQPVVVFYKCSVVMNRLSGRARSGSKPRSGGCSRRIGASAGRRCKSSRIPRLCPEETAEGRTNDHDE